MAGTRSGGWGARSSNVESHLDPIRSAVPSVQRALNPEEQRLVAIVQSGSSKISVDIVAENTLE